MINSGLTPVVKRAFCGLIMHSIITDIKRVTMGRQVYNKRHKLR